MSKPEFTLSNIFTMKKPELQKYRNGVSRKFKAIRTISKNIGNSSAMGVPKEVMATFHHNKNIATIAYPRTQVVYNDSHVEESKPGNAVNYGYKFQEARRRKRTRRNTRRQRK
jgi:hypothetical protein